MLTITLVGNEKEVKLLSFSKTGFYPIFEMNTTSVPSCKIIHFPIIIEVSWKDCISANILALIQMYIQDKVFPFWILFKVYFFFTRSRICPISEGRVEKVLYHFRSETKLLKCFLALPFKYMSFMSHSTSKYWYLT